MCQYFYIFPIGIPNIAIRNPIANITKNFNIISRIKNPKKEFVLSYSKYSTTVRINCNINNTKSDTTKYNISPDNKPAKVPFNIYKTIKKIKAR